MIISRQSAPVRPSAHRNSMMRFLPSIHPRSRSPSPTRPHAAHDLRAETSPKKPTRAAFADCARTREGQEADETAAPPSRVMNSRRFRRSKRIRSAAARPVRRISVWKGSVSSHGRWSAQVRSTSDSGCSASPFCQSAPMKSSENLLHRFIPAVTFKLYANSRLRAAEKPVELEITRSSQSHGANPADLP